MQTEVVAEYSEVEPLDITASLLLLRMTVEEVGQRPMALLGQLGEVRGQKQCGGGAGGVACREVTVQWVANRLQKVAAVVFLQR